MSEYKLYCFAQSGNAYKPALMLNLCGADWEPAFVDFMNGEHRTDAYREINPMGEVPVLQHRGERLTQSGVILDYLVRLFGKFGPQNEAERREIWRRILYDNHKFTSYMGTYRFLSYFLKTDNEATEFLKARRDMALGLVENHMKGRDFVATDRPTIADISMMGYLYYDGEHIGLDWADYPNIDAWRGRIKALPGWEHPYDLMPGHPLPGAST